MATNEAASAALSEPTAAPVAEVQALYERRAAQLWAFGRRLGLTNEQAEDAVQEAFARLVRTSQVEGAVRQPDPWLFRAVNNLAMDHHRRSRRIREIAPPTEGSGEPRSSGSTAEHTEDTEHTEHALDLWAAVDRLPQRQRAVVYLHYRVDFDFRTIARILSISEVGARANAFRAIARLRREVDR